MICKYNGEDIEVDENALEKTFKTIGDFDELKKNSDTAEKERDEYKAKYEAIENLYKETFSGVKPKQLEEAPEEKLKKVFEEVYK